MEPQLRCSFCSKSETQVRKLVAGGAGGHICDQCVSIAARIIADSDARPETRGVWRRMRSGFRALLSGCRSPSILRATSS